MKREGKPERSGEVADRINSMTAILQEQIKKAKYQHDAEILRVQIVKLKPSPDFKDKEKLIYSMNIIVCRVMRSTTPEVIIRELNSLFSIDKNLMGKGLSSKSQHFYSRLSITKPSDKKGKKAGVFRLF